MSDRELLINSLIRQFEKDRISLKKILLYELNEVSLVTHKGNQKITMIIKIEKEEE